jgi:hypothetical protein
MIANMINYCGSCPVQVVPKKEGMTIVQNDKNELIPQRTVTGWRMCIQGNKERSFSSTFH